jgi:hypothetical protein
MSNRKFAKAMQNLAREVQKFHRQFNRAMVNWLLRWAFVAQRRGQSPIAGFVLPTTVLLLLVLTLTVGAMTLRAFDRNTQVIANAQERVIYNTATPAIDRARSKLEFLFGGGDSRYPGGVPGEDTLLALLTNNPNGLPAPDGSPDAYTLPDERRLDIGSNAAPNPDGQLDNAWQFRADSDGDGNADATVVYSIIFETPTPVGGQSAAERLLTLTDQQKANQRLVRNAPISSQTRLTGCSNNASGSATGNIENGWFADAGSTVNIRKTFQVNALVIPDDPKAANVTLEFQQDRQIVRGNKWGAWFRYDLEIFPGPQFNWNGAMHTEGSMFFGGNNFNAYLVSSPASCLYQPESSELSITDRTAPAANDPNAADLGDFEGQAAAGVVGRPPFRQASVNIHVQTNDTAPPAIQVLNADNDSTTEPTAVGNIASDPVTIVLEERTQSVNAADQNNRAQGAWATKLNAQLAQRFRNQAQRVPFVDDLYRADNRWGPKPKYDDNPGGRVPATANVGDEIPAGDRLTSTPPATGTGDDVSIGLDGYWERRARTEGLRILVGERLELGNIGGWVTPRDVDQNGVIDPLGRVVSGDYVNASLPRPAYSPSVSATNPTPLLDLNDLADPLKQTELEGDPLYPPTVRPFPVSQNLSQDLPHLTQQRRSLRDNIPAVQAAAVYHAAVGNKDYPVACVALTAHPGTPNTLRQSFNFFPTNFKDNTVAGAAAANTSLLSDFFNGRGTNGWEYTPPGGDVAGFVAQLAVGQPLRIALDNLAHFAGDPDGAFPPLQEANRIHPYPALSMWGNFSNLRRALNRLDAVGYDAISVADKTYLQTAACTLGMLASNIDQLQKFDPTNSNNDFRWNSASAEVMSALADRIARLMDGLVENGEVLPKARLRTYGYNPAQATPDAAQYNPADYYEVPPEAFIAALKQQVIQNGGDYLNDPAIRLAELIMTSHQVRRDRTFGFRPSPAFGEYVVFTAGAALPARVFPTACDPDLFALNDSTLNPPPLGLRRTIAPTRMTESQTVTSLVAPASNWSLKPFLANNDTYTSNQEFPGAVVEAPAGSLAAKRLALSRLCGAIRVPRNYDPYAVNHDNNNIDGFDPAQRPVVLPKFPSLYYVFPEVDHGLAGAFVDDPSDNAATPEDVANRATEWDHRQPGMIGRNRAVADLNPPAVEANADYQAIAANGVNPRDREPYVTDAYINQANVAGNFIFRRISTVASPNPRLAAYPVPTTAQRNPVSISSITTNASAFSRRPYLGSSPYPAADLPVSAIALAPRQMNGFPANAPAAALPNYAPRNNANDTSPNRIMVPRSANTATASVSNLNTLPTTAWAVPFLDKVMFDGRQLQPARVTDIDWGMLRSTQPANQAANNTRFTPNETWLPMSGVVYGFREDAIREDGIARPIGNSPINGLGVTNPQLTPGTAMNARNLAQPSDPAVQTNGISVKPIDYLPDPDRRVHGFRMRNGTQLKRNPSVVAAIPAAENVRGLTFVTDQPVYMLGDFNLHQAGTGNETTRGDLLEEFTQQLFPDGAGVYNFDQFYVNRTTREPRFATGDEDRWRPSEILADGISILSDSFCDGSLADAFVAPVTATNQIPDFQVSGTNGTITYPNSIPRSVYNQFGLYGPSCTGNSTTSFQNQNRVSQNPPDTGRGWEWKREGATFVAPNGTTGTNPAWSDFTTPIQIGRTGDPLLVARPINRNATLPTNYNIGGLGRSFASPTGGGGRLVPAATDTRMNAIVVSGLPPSRRQQSYGGLHNFPRFLENWGGDRFFFSGSFLQLNFSNYATGPFEQEGWEPINDPVTDGEPIPHYSPPNRLWGYDVALQVAPASPAAARFVAPSATRSEFYTEPPVSDPYINKLCVAAVNAGVTANCVSQQP